MQIAGHDLILGGEVGELALIFFDESLHVAGIIEEGGELFYHFTFERFGGDGLEVTVAATVAACAGIAEVVGAVALFGAHAVEWGAAAGTMGNA